MNDDKQELLNALHKLHIKYDAETSSIAKLFLMNKEIIPLYQALGYLVYKESTLNEVKDL